MPGTKTRGARLRLAAYIILTVAVAVCFWLVRDSLHANDRATKENHKLLVRVDTLAKQNNALAEANRQTLALLSAERSSRVEANSKTELILCGEIQTLKSKLKTTIAGSINEDKVLIPLLIKKGVISAEYATIVGKASAKYDQELLADLSPINCKNLPYVRISKNDASDS